MTSDRPSIADERARVQAERRAARDTNRSHLDDLEGAGAGVIRLDLVVTAVTVTMMIIAVAARDETVDIAVAAASLAIAACGIAAFGIALWNGAQRSRESRIGIGGWFFLVGAAPRPVAVKLNGCLVVQTVTVIVAASIRPYTPVAFGTLIPMFGLALNGVWGARFGWFPDRDAPPAHGGGRTGGTGSAPAE